MKTLNCKICKKEMGVIEKGKIRNGFIVLCDGCWNKAETAIQMAELAKNQSKNYDMPDFLRGLFSKAK